MQIGNAWIDDNTNKVGVYDYYWTHALNSNETNAAIHKYCNFVIGNSSSKCDDYQTQGDLEVGNIDTYNIYAPICKNAKPTLGTRGSVHDFDPCSNNYVSTYLNLAEVQTSLHAKATAWEACRSMTWTDSPTTILPTVNQLILSGISVWIYSGDVDGRVPVTSSRYSINTLKLPVTTAWRPCYSDNEVGEYVVGYKGMTFTTAGHEVSSYQPERALTMVSSFLTGKLPPSE